jgi:L-2,4-diaminobutyric acid acetyltransferase
MFATVVEIISEAFSGSGLPIRVYALHYADQLAHEPLNQGYHLNQMLEGISAKQESVDDSRREPRQPLTLRPPVATDGPRVTRLIGHCPPLDTNSAYCNLLQCTDFAGTSVIAESEGELLGWISAYRPPSSPECLFVWQVAVSAQARGMGLAGRMLDALLGRPEVAGATALTTTITADNAASWALFEAFARRHGATLTRTPRFEREAHFARAHDTEWQARIAPLPTT